ncbi:hypothetical protein [Bacillus toyonensis]|uniref:hypothetical protein n=1 Tax=Bacillus toyonensis TaxID=155322 RepID=UPI003D1FAA14
MITYDQFGRIFRAKISHGKRQRLKAIQEYFATRLGEQHEFLESEECLEIILRYAELHLDREQQVLSDIIDLLHDRYSNGNSFYIYNLTTNQNLTLDDFIGVIEDFFGNTIVRDMFDFTNDQGLIIDRIGETVKVKAKYKEFQKDIGNDARTDTINHSGQIPVLFDFSNQKALINTGYNKAANTLIKAINEALGTSLGLREINIKNEVRLLPNLIGTQGLCPLTMLSVFLILQELSRNNYVVNDIIAISFNNEEAPRVKRANLGGTNLLQDSDVIHRIYRGDCITHFLLDIIHINNNANTDFISDVLFDFRSGLKLTFSNTQLFGVMTEEQVLIELENIIDQSINNQNTAAIAQGLINGILPSLNTNNEELLVHVIRDLRDSICNLINDENNRSDVRNYINTTYRL